MTRFRLGSHHLPVETGRWNGTDRHSRICTTCGEFGDENHAIYHCSLIFRDDIEIDTSISNIWTENDAFKLFKRLKQAKLL